MVYSAPDDGECELAWARRRRRDRIYVSKSFPLGLENSQDHNQPSRHIRKILNEATNKGEETHHWEEHIVHTSPGGQVQIRLLVSRESGRVKELKLEKVPTNSDATGLTTLLRLEREAAGKLIDLLQGIDNIPAEGNTTTYVDEDTIQEVTEDPETLSRIYASAPEGIRNLIEQDETAQDLVALASRRKQLERFRMLLTDTEAFDEERMEIPSHKPEAVWQRFLEQNSWILGASLTGQLLTSWNQTKLEQTVVGPDIHRRGKRVDALLATSGRIRSLVFAEIKHHQTSLLGPADYRAGCYRPSIELTGGITQIQQTVHLAKQDIGDRFAEKDPEGFDTGALSYLHNPRSFLIIGHLDQLQATNGSDHQDRLRSFELYRRNLHEPEIITFDELLARAEWHVTSSEQSDK